MTPTRPASAATPSLFMVPLLALALQSGAMAMPKAAPGDTAGLGASGSGAADAAASMRDPFLSPPPGADSTGSAHIAAPERQEAVKLSAQGAFTSTSPKVGDSLDYVLQVEWQDTQVPVVVLAPDSLSFPGFKILGQATVHKKLASSADVKNHTEFIYRLRAQTQGSGQATSLKVRYLTGLSRQEEAIFVPTALIDILPAPVRLTDMLWFKLLGSLILLGGAAALAYACFKFAMRRSKPAEPAKTDLRPEVAALKNRMRSSAAASPEASKEILLTMEGLAVRFLRQENSARTKSVQGAAKDGSGVTGAQRFEPSLDAYLAGNGADGGTAVQELQDWAKLRELFRHAHFAGGHKEPHELQDAFRTFKRCLKITGEDEHD